jgi:hypothetical protein
MRAPLDYLPPWLTTIRRHPPATASGSPPLRSRITRLEKVVDRQGDFDIQLQRIAKLQADLDAIRSAWGTLKPRKRSS